MPAALGFPCLLHAGRGDFHSGSRDLDLRFQSGFSLLDGRWWSRDRKGALETIAPHLGGELGKEMKLFGAAYD